MEDSEKVYVVQNPHDQVSPVCPPETLHDLETDGSRNVVEQDLFDRVSTKVRIT
jgi:hypothetical protein